MYCTVTLRAAINLIKTSKSRKTLNYIEKLRSYRTVNTHHLCFKNNQLLVYRDVIAVFMRPLPKKVNLCLSTSCRHTGGRSISAPFFHNLDTRWRWVVNFTSRPLYRREGTLTPVEYETGWAPEQVWTFWRRVKSLAHTGIRTQGSILQTTALSG